MGGPRSCGVGVVWLLTYSCGVVWLLIDFDEIGGWVIQLPCGVFVACLEPCRVGWIDRGMNVIKDWLHPDDGRQ